VLSPQPRDHSITKEEPTEQQSFDNSPEKQSPVFEKETKSSDKKD